MIEYQVAWYARATTVISLQYQIVEGEALCAYLTNRELCEPRE
jgi:hypothetical protein